MSERNEGPSVGTGTAEIPVVRPQGATVPSGGTVPPGATVPPRGEPGATPPVPAPEATPRSEPSAEGDLVPAMHATAPVTVRPSPRMPRRGPLTVMGPWAPVAGGLLGLILGVVAVLFLAGSAEVFEERLTLVFLVLGLGMLGTSGILLGNEVAMQRTRARDAAVRPAWVEATAGLLNGVTPARLLLAASAFVLFLAAYVSRG